MTVMCAGKDSSVNQACCESFKHSRSANFESQMKEEMPEGKPGPDRGETLIRSFRGQRSVVPSAEAGKGIW
jgi:hypothetical protein